MNSVIGGGAVWENFSSRFSFSLFLGFRKYSTMAEVTINSDAQVLDQLVCLLNDIGEDQFTKDPNLDLIINMVQNYSCSEDKLAQVVNLIYMKAVYNRSFAPIAAKLCCQLETLIVEGTKFRSLLLDIMQRDFIRRMEFRESDPNRWLGVIAFLCEVFGVMRSNLGNPYKPLTGPIYTCLLELVDSEVAHEDAIVCCAKQLLRIGRLLEEQCPASMPVLLAAIRDRMMAPRETALTRSVFLEIIELRANNWVPLHGDTGEYFKETVKNLSGTP